MNFKKYLIEISENSSLPTKAKIHLISGLKEALITQIDREKKVNKCLPHNSKALVEQFQTTYKGINEQILNTENQMMQAHKSCMQLLNFDSISLEEQVNQLQKLAKINSRLKILIKKVNQKKEVIEELSKDIEDHLRFKKAKIQFQYQKKAGRKVEGGSEKENIKKRSNIIY